MQGVKLALGGLVVACALALVIVQATVLHGHLLHSREHHGRAKHEEGYQKGYQDALAALRAQGNLPTDTNNEDPTTDDITTDDITTDDITTDGITTDDITTDDNTKDTLATTRATPPSRADAKPPEKKQVTATRQCSGPVKPPAMQPAEANELRKKLLATTKQWGYGKYKPKFTKFAGKRVLDLGMGQGPIGVVAIDAGVAKYTGLDPALCINENPKTRDHRVGRAPGRAECELIKAGAECRNVADPSKCTKYLKCVAETSSKYKTFPYTGLDMMAAYTGRVMLLPGTFDSLQHSGFLKKGMFDVASLWSVTEHLPYNRQVIEGIFEWLKPGQLVAFSHHNYYGYDGHHGVPRHPDDFNKGNTAHRALHLWAHLSPSSFVASKPSLNRIRLGDLMALFDAYFKCSWLVSVVPGSRGVLKGEVLAKLQAKGFQHAELLVGRWNGVCIRRPATNLGSRGLDGIVEHHPPMDGSYTPRPLPAYLVKSAVQERKSSFMYVPPGTELLKGILMST